MLGTEEHLNRVNHMLKIMGTPIIINDSMCEFVIGSTMNTPNNFIGGFFGYLPAGKAMSLIDNLYQKMTLEEVNSVMMKDENIFAIMKYKNDTELMIVFDTRIPLKNSIENPMNLLLSKNPNIKELEISMFQ